MTLLEVDEAANAISAQVDPDANIILGAAFDPSLHGQVRVSVVATGMDGASMVAIEPHRFLRADPVAKAPEPEPVETAPVAAEVEAQPEPAFAAFEASEPAQPRVFEPLRAFNPVTAAAAPQAPVDQGGFVFDEPALAAAPEPAPAAEPVRTVARIVDPSVADDDDEPLFPQTPYSDERRQKSGGWLSLFGRPRQDSHAPAPQARSAGGAQLAPEPLEDAHAEDTEDLEIPSFLRRLAN
jgi:cell division protein FtsZ